MEWKKGEMRLHEGERDGKQRKQVCVWWGRMKSVDGVYVEEEGRLTREAEGRKEVRVGTVRLVKVS